MKRKAVIIITLFRGLFATVLGLVLLFQPEKTTPILGNFMGVFWLASGLISLRWGSSGERARGWALLAGVIGVLAGVAMLGRTLVDNYIPQDVMISILGVVILLTGILHAFGGFQIGDNQHRKLSVTSVILGVFEIVLGTMLIIEPLGRSTFFYLAATIWALVGGFILIGDAFRLHKDAQQKSALQELEVEKEDKFGGSE
ncbi:unnamed protein product [marine sediment metagenome]|uniref:DUF308 domain-containing protein n=1 Tax=marine sediment metagenome TaxID=412755 RepID=X0RM43_9ZZZZ